MKNLLVKILAVCLALTTGAAHAFGCVGPVTMAGIGNIGGTGSPGDVYVSIGTGPVHSICNIIAQGSYTVPVPVCLEIYKKLDVAQITGQTMTLYYSSYSCTSFPSWSVVPSFYFLQS